MDNNLNFMQGEHSSLQAFLEMDTGYLSELYFDQEEKNAVHENKKDFGFLIPVQFIN